MISTVATFTDQDDALSSLAVLMSNGIKADLSQKHNNGVHIYELNVPNDEMSNATFLLGSQTEVAELRDNYMTDFSDEELEDIVLEELSYSPVMVENAKELLKIRYPGFSFEDIERKKKAILLTHKKGVKANKSYILLGYCLAILGGVIGLGIGWSMETTKVKGTDHKYYYTYDQESRKHGKRVKWLSILFLILYVILNLLRANP